MNWSVKNGAIKKSILALLTASSLFVVGCNSTERSALRVAGGTIDGADGEAKYPATVYVELKGIDYNNSEAIIRNVGTIVDVGLNDSYALILSLADVFQPINGMAVLPVMKEVHIKLYLSSGKDEINLPALKMTQSGLLEDQSKKTYFMMAVGVKAQKTGSSDAQTDRIVSDLSQKLFLESPLLTEKGVNFRDALTSYIMISIPKNVSPSLASLKVPSIMSAESRPEPEALKGVVVGFGENPEPASGTNKDTWALSDALPGVMKRNYADIKPLNKSANEYTPFRIMLGASSPASKQLWEFTGSGLCGSKSGSNYDTGAAVYIDGKFAGFGVRSTLLSSGEKGRLADCSGKTRNDIATLVVSPSDEHISQFKARSHK